MAEYLVLRFEAPLMSFGGVRVDNRGVCDPFPGVSLLTGLIGNALGWHHADTDRLAALQRRIRHGVRRDIEGQPVRDYQTADLGQAFLKDTGWTRAGYVDVRGGGAAATGTTIRLRDYIADASFTVVLRLEPAAASPTLDEVESALSSPYRPLFLGRKPCIPSTRILVGRVDAESIPEALRVAPATPRVGRQPRRATAWWPSDEGTTERTCTIAVRDLRDWANQAHTGKSTYVEGSVEYERAP